MQNGAIVSIFRTDVTFVAINPETLNLQTREDSER